jgi:uncharacterized protein
VSENVELVKQCFKAISAWDIDAVVRLYHPDVEFLPLTGTRVETGGYRGHEGMRAYLAEARELWDVLEPEGHQYVEMEDRVLVSGHCRVRGRSSGAESDPACAWVIVVRDGRIIFHRACSSFDEALEVGGASAPM